MKTTLSITQAILILLLGCLVKDLSWLKIIGVFIILISYGVTTAIRLVTK